MPRKSKSQTGTVEYVNKPTEDAPAPAPSILPEPPKVDIPEQGSPTSAPPPPAPKSKRGYKKKNGEYWEAMKGSRKELLMKPSGANEVVYPKEEPAPEKKPSRSKKEKVVKQKPVKPPKAPKPVKEKPIKAPKPPSRKARVYEPSSEEEDEDDDEEEEESESEEEEPEVEVVAKKAVRRIKTLEKIDRRIKQLSNPYTAQNRFSIF